MDKIQGKALTCMGYLVSFPRGRGTRTATLIKRRHKDTSPPWDGLVLCPELSLLDAPGNLKCLPPSPELPLGNVCAQEELGSSTNIRATLTWNHTRKVGTRLCIRLWFSKVRKDLYSSCWAACSGQWHEDNVSLHSSKGKVPNTARVTQNVVGTVKAGYPPPPWHTQGQGVSSWSTLPWGPQNFGACRKLHFSSFKLKVN